MDVRTGTAGQVAESPDDGRGGQRNVWFRVVTVCPVTHTFFVCTGCRLSVCGAPSRSADPVRAGEHEQVAHSPRIVVGSAQVRVLPGALTTQPGEGVVMTQKVVRESDVLASFDEALAASEKLRDTFARIGDTHLQRIAERNITSIVEARTAFLSVVREVRRHVDVHPVDEDLEPGVDA